MEKMMISTIKRLVHELVKQQKADGRWKFCLESGTMTDAYMILIMQVLSKKDSVITKLLTKRILNRQTSVGTWKLYEDEKEGNLSATIESSLALLYAGVKDPTDSMMVKAREFIRSRGGITQASTLTKVLLTLLGHMKWSNHPRIPVEVFLFPLWFPFNFFDLVGYARVHIAPILIASDRKYSVSLPRKQLVSDWLRPIKFLSKHSTMNQHNDWSHDIALLLHQLPYHLPLPHHLLHRQAIRWGELFIRQRIEADGTLYSYFSSTFFMIFALLSLGYHKKHPVIQNALQGISTYLYHLQDGAHLQETTSTVWDTSLILHALQEAGMSDQHPTVKRGLHYIHTRQHTTGGDWMIRNPGVSPGGWGFSDINTINPDVDDTTACLRALSPSVRHQKYQKAWGKGVRWVLSMQNQDGGWSAFEKNTAKRWTRFLPFQDGPSVLGDPSTADLTGRTLEFIGKELNWDLERPAVQRAVKWLRRNQEQDGSWFGRWGISYIYGTWAALTGLLAVQVPQNDKMVNKGIEWLLSVQNSDGGWGESCSSDVNKRYIPLGTSTVSQTAWALDALIACYDQPTAEMEKGVKRLIALLDEKEWSTVYPTGAGLAGQFYIHYHSYYYIWPLLTLAHYHNKYGSENEL